MQRIRRHAAIVVTTMLHLLCPGSSTTAPRDLVYYVEEECDVGKSIGHLVPDAGLDDRYPPEVVGSLRFRFLSPAPPYIGLDESTGWLFVSGLIDRDVICQRELEICRIEQDVAVQPVQYFSILKVSINLYWQLRCLTTVRYYCSLHFISSYACVHLCGA